MPRILFRYVFREVLYPSLLTVGGMTVILLLAARAPGFSNEYLIFMVMRMFFREDTPNDDLLGILVAALPSIMLFITPMALLIGILIGIGRMTLDLEVRAMQTGGIPLYILFLPILGLAAVLSMGVAAMSFGPEPMLIRSSVSKVGRLLVGEFSNLEAGRIYDELFGKDSGMNLYFDDRDPETNEMVGVTLLVDQGAVESDPEADRLQDVFRTERRRLQDLHDEGRITKEELDRQVYEMRIATRRQNPVMIFASSADFDADPVKGEVELSLRSGSIHVLEAGDSQAEIAMTAPGLGQSGPGLLQSATRGNWMGPPPVEPSTGPAVGADADDDRQYVTIQFGQMRRTEHLGSLDARESRRMQTLGELYETMRDVDRRDRDRLRAKAAMLERISAAFQCFVLAFIGLPLAVSARPSGKSIGVIMAFALILIYQLLLRTGYAMVESDATLGEFMIFMPNLLFLAVGVFLWRRSLRA